MAQVSAGREAALEILRAVDRGRRLDRALDETLERTPARERAWVHELTFGVQRLRGRLDHLLDHHLHSGLDSVSPLLRDLLRMGAHQLLYMDGVPDYAALSQTVEQARKETGEGAAGLVNGVLRSVQRSGDQESLFPDPEDDPVGHLSTRGSHPRWLVERWLGRWSREEVTELVELDNTRPRLFVRPVGVSPKEARALLSAEGVEATPVGRGTGGLRIGTGTSPERVLEILPAVVQDPGSSLVVEYAAPQEGSRVADLCAAPGGKALALAPSASYVLAGDASGPRVSVLRRAVRRLGSAAAHVGGVVARAEAPPVAEADLVLLDVPCTGTGTLRRRPDARWRLESGDVERMAGLQCRILDGAAAAVRPGGLLVYSTCTLEPEENEQQVLRFLDEHGEFGVEVVEGVVPDEFVDERGFLRVLPQRSGFDGAFAARLRRAP